VQDVLEVGCLEPAGLNGLEHGEPRGPPIAGDERFHAAIGPHPRAVAIVGPDRESRQQIGVQERQVAGDDDHAVGALADLERGIQAADRAGVRHEIRIHCHAKVGEAAVIRRDDAYIAGHPLQNLQLTYDDGTPMDDEPALVSSTKPASLPPGENRRSDGRSLHSPLIMTEARIGRLLAASLHQAILDVLPQRLEFYEHWLHPEGLRDGSIGLAPMTAVLGFLRTEREEYDPVMMRAGHLAAEWTLMSRSAVSRQARGWLPRSFRLRAALRVAAEIMRDVSSATRVTVRVRRREAKVVIKSSLFCAVRERPASPLCTFYAGIVTETLKRFGLPGEGRIESCRAMDGEACVVGVNT
jgi:predicted hydrocarbon binding protein